VTSITQVSMMSNDIATASEEQAHGVKEIGTAVTQLDTVVHSNALSAEEAARAADSLSDQAKSLQSTASDMLKYLTGDGEQIVSYASAAEPTARASASKKRGKPALKLVSKNSKPKASAKPAAPVSEEQPVKQAACAEVAVPSADDPRFKDI